MKYIIKFRKSFDESDGGMYVAGGTYMYNGIKYVHLVDNLDYAKMYSSYGRAANAAEYYKFNCANAHSVCEIFLIP